MSKWTEHHSVYSILHCIFGLENSCVTTVVPENKKIPTFRQVLDGVTNVSSTLPSKPRQSLRRGFQR